MSEDLDEKLKLAELSRLSAETEKLRAEKKKIERDLHWFAPHKIIKTLLAFLASMPLIWFYIDKMIIPSFQAENIRLNLENEIARDSLFRARKEVVEIAKQNRITMDSLQLVSIILDSTKKYYKRKLDDLAQEYKMLSQNNLLTKKERDRYKTAYDDIQGKYSSQEKQLQGLANEVQYTRAQEFGKAKAMSLNRPYGILIDSSGETAQLGFNLYFGNTVSVFIVDSTNKKVKYFYIDEPHKEGGDLLRWDGKDDNGKKLPDGIYECMFKLGESKIQSVPIKIKSGKFIRVE